MALDVTDDASVRALAASLADTDVTVLVANAGGAFDAATIADADLDSDRELPAANDEVLRLGPLTCRRGG